MAEVKAENPDGEQQKIRWYEVPFDVIISGIVEAIGAGIVRGVIGLISRLF